MKIFPGMISTAVIVLIMSLRTEGADSQPVPGQTAADYKAKIDTCIASLSKKDNTAQERGAAAFSASFLIESYYQFAGTGDAAQQQKLRDDGELMNKLCTLHILFAEYQLEEAKTKENPPSVSALEKAFRHFNFAVICLNNMTDRETIARNGKWIELGLTQTIAGLNKYADWFEHDVFMNPEGKKWGANPVAKAERLRKEISGKSSSSGELAACEKALDAVIKDIQRATERRDGNAALENMILWARWLTTILRKSPEAFINDFQKYNAVTRVAMEEVKKGYSSERMKEFTRFYEPLKSHYLNLTAEKK